MLAEWTGLEPATPGVTGRYSNQLNYHSKLHIIVVQAHTTALWHYWNIHGAPALFPTFWRPLGDSNPCTHRERVMS